MQSFTFTKMTRADAEHDFDDSYTLEHSIPAGFGWKVIYNVNEKYSIEDVLGFAFIRNGLYWEMIPMTPHEVHSPQSLPNYVLKDGYVGMITPDNRLSGVEDIDHLDVQAIREALKKNRIKLD